MPTEPGGSEGRPEDQGGRTERQGWDLRYQGDELVFRADPSAFLGPEVGSLAPGRALDLGCGEGRNAVWLAERGWWVTGVDFSEVGVAKARGLARLRGLNVDWMVADLRTVPLPPATFDLVIQLFVHFPAPERRALLRRASAALCPGGTILVVGYDVRHLTSGGGGPRDPNLLFTLDGVVADLPGLDIERAEQLAVPAGHDDAGAERFAVDVVVRARKPATANTSAT